MNHAIETTISTRRLVEAAIEAINQALLAGSTDWASNFLALDLQVAAQQVRMAVRRTAEVKGTLNDSLSISVASDPGPDWTDWGPTFVSRTPPTGPPTQGCV